MTARFGPYLGFAGQAREAMEFYESVFGGELRVFTFADFGASPDPSWDDLVMHSELTTPFFTLFGADDLRDGESGGANAVTLAVVAGSPEDTARWWAALAEGGTIQTPLELQQWGDVYGAVTDRYGFRWGFDYAAEGEG
jgi:PhnB protein